MWKLILLIFCILLEPIASRGYRGPRYHGIGSSSGDSSSSSTGDNDELPLLTKIVINFLFSKATTKKTYYGYHCL
uniref:Uncharacterized protein n=1 Tax=Acrobeloides nanus TaxID=290746 RepID=A0A914E8B4_9BILA